jgi:hypothetical protein
MLSVLPVPMLLFALHLAARVHTVPSVSSEEFMVCRAQTPTEAAMFTFH